MIDGPLPALLDLGAEVNTAPPPPVDDPAAGAVFAALVAQLLVGTAMPSTATSEAEAELTETAADEASGGDPSPNLAASLAGAAVGAASSSSETEGSVASVTAPVDAARAVSPDAVADGNAGTSTAVATTEPSAPTAPPAAATDTSPLPLPTSEQDAARNTLPDQATDGRLAPADTPSGVAETAAVDAVAGVDQPTVDPSTAGDLAPASSPPARHDPLELPSNRRPAAPGDTGLVLETGMPSLAGDAVDGDAVDGDAVDGDVASDATPELPAEPAIDAAADAPLPIAVEHRHPEGRPSAVDAPAAVPAPVGDSQEVADQVAARVTSLRLDDDGQHEISLDLHPAELGSVGVDVVVDGGTVHVTVRADQPAAADLLRDALDDLRQSLRDAGLDVGDLVARDRGSDRDTPDHPGTRHGRGDAPIADLAAAFPTRVPSSDRAVDVLM